MKKILLVILVVIVITTCGLISCGDKTVENHPDAVAAATEFEEAFKIFEEYSDGDLKVYAAAKETGVIITFVVNDENYDEYDKNNEDDGDDEGISPASPYDFDVNSFIDSVDELFLSNPFESVDVPAKYPSLDSVEIIVKNYEGHVYYQHKYKK